tara:strand:+ start:250 stop:522 length:273 start_codon:yes stop_codon:yes gene_type:complete
MEYKKKESKSKSISFRVKPSTYQKLEELMDSLFIENSSDFIEFVVDHFEIKNKELLKEYLETIEQLEKKRRFIKAKLEIGFRNKPEGEED